MIDISEHGGSFGGGGGRNIKSIQRGVLSYLNATSVNVTISAIDPTKSIILISSDFAQNTAASASVNAKIVNGTTINFSTYVADSGNTATISWQVIEFKNVKSLQAGITSFTTTESSKTQNITSVNTEKSIVFATIKTNDNSNKVLYEGAVTSALANPTTLTFTRKLVFSVTAEVQWQVVEFN